MDYLTKTYPALPHAPLHRIIESDPLGLNIAGELRKVIQRFNNGGLPDGP